MRLLHLYKEKRPDTALYQTYCSSMEAPTGFEPAIRQLQCRALPLGYRAINLRSFIISKSNINIKQKNIFLSFWHSCVDSAKKQDYNIVEAKEKCFEGS